MLGFSKISTMALSTASAPVDNLGRRKEPHAVDKPDQTLLVAAQRELVAGVGVQQQVRRAHHEIGINGLPFRDLGRDPLKAVLRALRVDGAEQRGTASDKRPQESRQRADQGWIDGHNRLHRVNEWEWRRLADSGVLAR